MKRGEIYLVDLGAAVNNERGGVRPVVVVSSDVNNLHPYTVAVVAGEDVALTSPKSGIHVPAADSGAPLDIVFFIHQLRSIRADSRPVPSERFPTPSCTRSASR